MQKQLSQFMRVLKVESNSENLLKGRSWRSIIQIALKVVPMALRGFWYKVWLASSNGPLFIGKQVVIRDPQYVSVGRNFVAEDFCEIQGISERGISIGDRVTVGRFAMIRPSGYYGREIGSGLTIGNGSNIGPYCYIGCSGGITIGQNVLMGPRVSLFAENHNFDRPDIPMKEQGVTRKPIVIEDDCWLASSCTILAGVHVGRGAVIGASAVVTKDVPAYAIVGGVPAKVLSWRRPPASDEL